MSEQLWYPMAVTFAAYSDVEAREVVAAINDVLIERFGVDGEFWGTSVFAPGSLPPEISVKNDANDLEGRVEAENIEDDIALPWEDTNA